MGLSLESPVVLRLFVKGVYPFLVEVVVVAMTVCTAAVWGGVLLDPLAISIIFEFTNGVFGWERREIGYESGGADGVLNRVVYYGNWVK
jgi:hypothetical protein